MIASPLDVLTWLGGDFRIDVDGERLTATTESASGRVTPVVSMHSADAERIVA
ncbi:hypothetical protein [Nocardia arizonensis]|uniref:hypothetical protein n=1 Tax=Nocardia arizonensis TaxID=1141647 RepID=UPI000A8F3444|nr:hypothetical protein [Nocardia arizonensis]